MNLSLRAKRRISILLLCIGLPCYIIAAVTILGMIERPPVLVEFGVYALAGILWALPFRTLFRGICTDEMEEQKSGEA
ncbi:MAG: DUF2842 domain-containing protein [Rhodobacteraceae bacterium]|nr:DUF2842 domain-containing protein [Paracoccaceae bacterium]